MSHPHIPIILQSFAAIGAGLVTAVGLGAIAGLLQQRLQASREGAYFTLGLIYNALFAMGGGYVTAFIANLDPLRHVFMLAMALLLLAALSALQSQQKMPRIFQLALVALVPVSSLAGGLLRMYQTGYRW